MGRSLAFGPFSKGMLSLTIKTIQIFEIEQPSVTTVLEDFEQSQEENDDAIPASSTAEVEGESEEENGQLPPEENPPSEEQQLPEGEITETQYLAMK